MNNPALRSLLQDLTDAGARIVNKATVPVHEAVLKKGQWSVRAGKTPLFRVEPSALYSFMGKVLSETLGTDARCLYDIRTPGPGQTTLFRAIHFGKESQLILRLIDYLAKHNEIAEARLCAIQSQLLEDFRMGIVQQGSDFQEGVQVGIDLFSNFKLRGERLMKARSRSSAALVEKLLPLVQDSDPCESLYAADAALQAVPQAFLEVTDQRRAHMLSALRKAEEHLLKQPHSLLNDYATLFATLRA